jgi:hypothetical protein
MTKIKIHNELFSYRKRVEFSVFIKNPNHFGGEIPNLMKLNEFFIKKAMAFNGLEDLT